jgi:hypothetical protein
VILPLVALDVASEQATAVPATPAAARSAKEMRRMRREIEEGRST